MKYKRPHAIYGELLLHDFPTFLGIAESKEESEQLMAEYSEAFAEEGIVFWSVFATEEQYQEEKRKALNNLLNALNGPIDIVILTLRNCR
jgi:hypothetical protein